MSSTVIAAASPRLADERVDEPVEPDPTGGLDQDDVAVAEAWPERVERGLGVGCDVDARSDRGPASAAPSAMRGRSGADDDQQFGDGGRAAAHGRGRLRGPRRARASRRGPRRGRPGRPASRSSAAHRAGRRVVAVVQDRPRRAAGPARAMRAPTSRRRGPPRSRRGPCRRPGRRPPRPGVVDAVAAERRDRAPRPSPAGVRSVKRIPAAPAESTSRPDVGVRRRSRSARPGRRSRRSIRATRGSSALRTAVPSAGSASTSSPLPARSRRASRSATGARPGRR